MKAVVWEDEGLGAKYHDEEIPADLLDKAKEYRLALIEAAVELDDDAMAAYLDGQEPDEETLNRLIRKAVRKIAFIPMFCGSAFKNKGVQPLLDAVVRLSAVAGRSRGDQGRRRGHGRGDLDRKPLDSEPFSMLAFKIMDDPFVGTITFARVYSGKIDSGTTVLNSTKEKKERIGRMLLMHANNREDIKEAYCGRHRRARGPQGHAHRRHALRHAEAGHSGAHGVPRSGHRDRHRAEVEGRSGEARRRAAEARGGGSVLPRFDRSGKRPDHPQGHGRTASRHQGRHFEAHL